MAINGIWFTVPFNSIWNHIDDNPDLFTRPISERDFAVS